jgi:hypothetical protein
MYIEVVKNKGVEYIRLVQSRRIKNPDGKSLPSKKVLCIEDDIVFNSVVEASKCIHTSAKNPAKRIYEAIRTGTTAYSKHWKYL